MTLHAKESRTVSTEEEILYGDGMVWVTNRRLVFNDDSFDLRGVKAAEIRTSSPRVDMKRSIIAWLIAVAALGLGLFNLTWPRQDPFSFDLQSAASSFCIGILILIALGALIMVPTRVKTLPTTNVYGLALRRIIAQDIAIASLNRAYLENIAKAVKYAVALNKGATAVRPGFTATTRPPQFAITASGINADTKNISLTSVESASTSQITLANWLLEAGITLPLLAINVPRFIERQFDFPGESTLWPTLGTLGILIITCALSCTLIYTLLNRPQKRYIVTVHKSTGEQPEVVFITPSMQEAKEVKTDIERAIQASTPALSGATL